MLTSLSADSCSLAQYIATIGATCATAALCTALLVLHESRKARPTLREKLPPRKDR